MYIVDTKEYAKLLAEAEANTQKHIQERTNASIRGIPHPTHLLERRRDRLHHASSLDHDPRHGSILKRRFGGPFGSDGYSETPLVLALRLEWVWEGRGLELGSLSHKISVHASVIVTW